MNLSLKCLAMWLAIGCAVSAASAQEITSETWDGGTSALYNLGSVAAVRQSFTVPAGRRCTSVEMFAQQHGNWAGQAGYYVNLALHEVYPDGSYSSSIVVTTWEWNDPIWDGSVAAFLPVSATELDLGPGTYDIQMWGNTETVNDRFFAKLYSSSGYTGGDARTGWIPGTPLAADQDFAARFTTVKDYVETWEGGTSSWYSLGTVETIRQSFTVPAHQMCTSVEMFAMQHGNWAQQPGYFVNLALYELFEDGSYGSAIAVKSWAWTDPIWQGGVKAFLPVSDTDLNLLPGHTYEIKMWGNTSTVCDRMFGQLFTGSTYADGQAKTGNPPSVIPLASDQDFAARLIIEPYVKPMDNAPIGWYDSRWGDQNTYPGDPDGLLAACNAKAEALHDEYCQVVLPYLSGVDFASYQRHVWAVGNYRMNLIFEFNRSDVNNERYSAIGALMSSFKDAWAVSGWYTADEPDGWGTPVEPLENVYDFIDANNVKPVYMAFNSTGVNGGEPVNYGGAYDVMLMDNYPFHTDDPLFEDLDDWQTVIADTAAQAELAGKPWWSIVQAMGSGWREDPPYATWRLPTFTEERFMTYWSILEGATGIMYWMHDVALESIAQPGQPYPYDGTQWVQDVTTPISREYRNCGGAIIGGEVAGAVTADNPDITAKVYQSRVGEYILIAANDTTGNESTTFTLSLPAAADPNDGPTVAIEFGNVASVTDITSGELDASFGPYDVRVYRLMPDEQVIETYADGQESWWKPYNAENEQEAATQWFFVPDGTVGTKFEFFCEIGGAPRTDLYHANVALFKEGGTLVGIKTVTADQFTSTNMWIAMEDLNLEPGRYYAQLFTNEPGFKGYMATRLVSNSFYGDGYAADGYSGGHFMEPKDDFWTRVTIEPASIVQGTVTLQDYVADITTVPVEMTIADPCQGTVLDSQTVYLDAAGGYGFTTGLASGTYDLSAKASHWLTQQVSAAIPGTADFVLINGDADDNNAVTMSDVLVLSDEFLQSGGSADLNGDGTVDLQDLAVIVSSWQYLGD